MRFIDQKLNTITMYRLLALGLGSLGAYASLVAAAGQLAFMPLALMVSTVLLLSVCLISNWMLAKLYAIPANVESSTITALILACTLAPGLDARTVLFTALAGLIAMASKYVIAWRGAHVINPAAFGLVALSWLGYFKMTWWIGSGIMLPAVLILGFLIVRKIRRADMVLIFLAVAYGVLVARGVLLDQRPIIEVAQEALFSWPLFFFATVMLTEPLTMPIRGRMRVIYAIVAALLCVLPWDLGFLYSSPQAALLIGNMVFFAIRPKRRWELRLKEVIKMSPAIWEYAFSAPSRPAFKAGQYAEWTIDGVRFDDRGNRRYFTVASAPSSDEVRLGVKFYPSSSAFKERLRGLQSGDRVFLGQVTGDFVLPDTNEPLLFLAGGIGITPFRSMLEEMMAQNERRDVVVCYAAANAEEIVYREVLERAQSLGAQVQYVLNNTQGAPTEWQASQGYIDQAYLSAIPNIASRRAYLSGPPAFVDAVSRSLKKLGIPSKRIIKDYFPGY